jgi:flagellar basal-body rod protein FlgF
MQSGLYVALSAQMALQKRMESLANNLANASVAGFRGEETKFESVMSDMATEQVAFASPGKTFIRRDAGQVTATGNPLDVAVQGDAWMAIQGTDGFVYTRDGRMKLGPGGELQSIAGYPILDVGGSPITIDPGGGPLQISDNGMISQNGRQLGAIGLFTIDQDANLQRFENSGVIPDKPAQPALDFSKYGIVQGHIEGSNVNPVMEMSQLILVSRSYDAVSNSINNSEDSLRDAIKSLGPGS